MATIVVYFYAAIAQ